MNYVIKGIKDDVTPLVNLSLTADGVQLWFSRSHVFQCVKDFLLSGRYVECLEWVFRMVDKAAGEAELERLQQVSENIGAGDALSHQPKKTLQELREVLNQKHEANELTDEDTQAPYAAYEKGYKDGEELAKFAQQPRPWHLASHPERARQLGRKDAEDLLPRKSTEQIFSAVGLGPDALPPATFERAREELRRNYDAAYDAVSSPAVPASEG